MPFNTVGFIEATPGTGTVPLNVALNEALYRVVTDDLYVTKEAPYILGVMAAGVSTMARAILRQPKMIDYDVIKAAEDSMSSPSCSYTHYFGRPLPLRVDKLNALAVNATDEYNIIGVWLGSGKITQAMLDAVNPTHVIHGIGDTTVTAATWSRCPITWSETLDAGIYEIVGMRVGTYISAAWQIGLARISIPGSQNWKPGVVTTRMLADHEEYQNAREELYSRWPLMGIRFDTQHMPDIDVLSAAALTDENVELTLQKVG